MTDTVTLPRSVVEQALEHLTCPVDEPVREAFRAALEQPQDHPEQHLDMVPEGWKLVPVEPTDDMLYDIQEYSHILPPRGKRIWAHMLNAAPQPPVVEQPQSVTNCHQSQPQVEQEPVAYYVMNGAALFQLFRSKSQADALAYDLQKRHDLSGSPAHFHVVPLYTHPQPCQPLTDGQINRLIADGKLPLSGNPYEVARAIERAHGIGG